MRRVGIVPVAIFIFAVITAVIGWRIYFPGESQR